MENIQLESFVASAIITLITVLFGVIIGGIISARTGVKAAKKIHRNELNLNAVRALLKRFAEIKEILEKEYKKFDLIKEKHEEDLPKHMCSTMYKGLPRSPFSILHSHILDPITGKIIRNEIYSNEAFLNNKETKTYRILVIPLLDNEYIKRNFDIDLLDKKRLKEKQDAGLLDIDEDKWVEVCKNNIKTFTNTYDKAISHVTSLLKFLSKI